MTFHIIAGVGVDGLWPRHTFVMGIIINTERALGMNKLGIIIVILHALVPADPPRGEL